MRRLNTYGFLLAILMLSNIKKGNSQTPLYDKTWTFQSSQSDDFNGSSLGSNWEKLHVVSPPLVGFNWGGNSRFTSVNTTVSSGELSFKVDAPFSGSTVPYDFTECCNTGGIQSVNFNYSYGYFEMYAKLPGFVDGSNIGHAYRFWPAFWLYYEPASNPCSSWVHDELDIVDPGGNLYSDAKSWGGNSWNENGPCTNYSVYSFQNISSTYLCSSYHKFAMEWNNDRAIFYLDDLPVGEKLNEPAYTMNNMRVVIDQQIEGSGCPNDFDIGTTFPQYMNVAYFYYYKLNKDCSSNLTILNNTDLSNYWTTGVPAVKSNITFGNGSNSVSLVSGDHMTFRAVNTITINGAFTVPSGAEFIALPTPCN